MKRLGLLLPVVLLLACSGGGSDSPAQSPDTTRVASATPTPEPTAGSALPVTQQPAPTAGPSALPTPSWSEPDDAFLQTGGPYNSLVLDTVTGDLITLSDEPVSPFSPVSLGVLGWSPDGRMAIGPVGRPVNRNQYTSILVGPPGGPWQTIDLGPFDYASHADFSPDGSRLTVNVLTPDGPRTYDVDVATGDVAGTSDGFGLVHSYSPDGRFRIQVRPSGNENQFEVTDLTTDQSVEFDGFSGTWSPEASVFAYTRTQADDPTRSEVVLQDFDARTSEVLMEGDFVHSWSPDGRYLVVGLSDTREDDFLIVDLTERGRYVKLTGAWARGWLEDGSLLYARNICGDFDLHAILPDGTEDTPVVTGRPGAGLTAVVSPAGDRVVYRTFGADGRLYVRMPDGQAEISVQAGMFSTPYGYWTEGNWSPDGRYVVLQTLPGKDGPCMGESAPRPTTVEVFP